MNKLIAHALVSAPLILVTVGGSIDTRPGSADPSVIDASQFRGRDMAQLLLQSEDVAIHVIQSATGHYLVQTDRESGEMEFLLNATNRPRIPMPVRPTFLRTMLLGVVVEESKVHTLVVRSRSHDTKGWNSVPRTTAGGEQSDGPVVSVRTFDLSNGERVYNTANKVRPVDAPEQPLTRIDLAMDVEGVLELRDGELFAFGEPVSDWH